MAEIQTGPFRWAVVNCHGFVTCTTDEGKRRHHVAVWDTEADAEHHARVCAALNPRGCPYRVVEVTITGQLPAPEVLITEVVNVPVTIVDQDVAVFTVVKSVEVVDG